MLGRAQGRKPQGPDRLARTTGTGRQRRSRQSPEGRQLAYRLSGGTAGKLTVAGMSRDALVESGIVKTSARRNACQEGEKRMRMKTLATMAAGLLLGAAPLAAAAEELIVYHGW